MLGREDSHKSRDALGLPQGFWMAADMKKRYQTALTRCLASGSQHHFAALVDNAGMHAYVVKDMGVARG